MGKSEITLNYILKTKSICLVKQIINYLSQNFSIKTNADQSPVKDVNDHEHIQ